MRNNLKHRGFWFSTDLTIENFGLADNEIAVFQETDRFIHVGWERELIKNNLAYAYVLQMNREVEYDDLTDDDVFKPFEETGIAIKDFAIIYESEDNGYEELKISLSDEEKIMFQEILEGKSPESNKFCGNTIVWELSVSTYIDGSKRPFDSIPVNVQGLIRKAINDGKNEGSIKF